MIRFHALIILACIQFSCGGGGGGSSGFDQPGRIIDRSGLTVGSITAFSSVIVNGVTYDTADAVITIDGVTSQQSALEVGQIVTIRGVVDNAGDEGDAQSVTSTPLARGPIAEINLGESKIVLLGTDILAGNDTRFAGSLSALADLQANDTISVHGFRSTDGTIVASWIGLDGSNTALLQGSVSDIDLNNQRFSINEQPVDFTTASLVDFNADIAFGNRVIVRGTFDGSLLTAQSVTRHVDNEFSDVDEGLELQLEGLIDSFSSTADFAVAGIRCTTNGVTTFSGGDANQLGPNVKVEVKGSLNANGILVADEIEFENDSDTVIEATVQSVDTGSQRVGLLNTEFDITTGTQFDDESDIDQRPFGIDNLQVGDFVKAKVLGTGAEATLSALIRKNPEDQAKLQGFVRSVDRPDLQVGSVLLRTSPATEFEIADVPTTADDFFAQLAIGDKVEAQGFEFVNGIPVALQVELDD